jgi:hypothetical protein
MKYNYKGFHEYFDDSILILKKSLETSYKKITGKKFNLHNNKFLTDIVKQQNEINLSDKELAAATALHLLDEAQADKDMLSKFKNYEFAFAIKGYVDKVLDIETFNSSNKRDAAINRWLKDPKSLEKMSVKECWAEWQKNKSNYKSKSAFANDMLNKFQNLKSVKVIEEWCRKWEKESVS